MKWRNLYKESENDFYATHSNREILETLMEDIMSVLPLRYKVEIIGNEIVIPFDTTRFRFRDVDSIKISDAIQELVDEVRAIVDAFCDMNGIENRFKVDRFFGDPGVSVSLT